MYCLVESISSVNDHLVLREPGRLTFLTTQSLDKLRQAIDESVDKLRQTIDTGKSADKLR